MTPVVQYLPRPSIASLHVVVLAAGGSLVIAGSAGCGGESAAGEPVATASASAAVVAPPEVPPSAAPSVSAAPSAAAAPVGGPPAEGWPGTSKGCRDEMVRVEGEYCPAVVQVCKKHHVEYGDAKGKRTTVSERCLEYENPSRCVSKKREHLAFCMDRFEYPGVLGEKPRNLTPWFEAKKLCEDRGKRLCTEDEYNFACEGPEILPYVYGFVRNKEICNIDREYRYPDHSKVLPTFDACPGDAHCKAEIERLDQREPIGQRRTCVSWAGVFDLNGNINEWVNLPKEKMPNRSGLKGGWWGPVRGRCRPTVTFHKESDYGYEAGFRCCSDVKKEG